MKQKSLTFKGLIKRYTGVLSLVEKQNAKKFKRIKKLENIKPKDEEKLTSEEITTRRREALILRGEIDEALENLKIFLDDSYGKVETLLDDSKKSIKKKAKYEKLPEITKLTEGHEILETSERQVKKGDEVEEKYNVVDPDLDEYIDEDIEDEADKDEVITHEEDEIDLNKFSVDEPPFIQEHSNSNHDDDVVLVDPVPLELEEKKMNADPYNYINEEETIDSKEQTAKTKSKRKGIKR